MSFEVVLFYFDFAGKGEPIRLALTHAGVPFVDKRVKPEEWKDKYKSKLRTTRGVLTED